MTTKKLQLKLIAGGRDQLERDLVKALFGVDAAEITRCSERLNSIQIKQPKLKLVKNESRQIVIGFRK